MEPPGSTTPVLIGLVTPWAWLSTVAANPRAAIYGTIVASAVIAATAAGGKSPALIMAATVG